MRWAFVLVAAFAALAAAACNSFAGSGEGQGAARQASLQSVVRAG